MNNDVLEVLQELEVLVGNTGGLDINWVETLTSFIDNQRSIYSGSSGECASC